MIINGYTAEHMKEIEDATIVDADIIDGDLVFTKHDGSVLNVGSVQGAQGDPGDDGPPGTTIVNPSGVILPYAGVAIPAGYLVCDGLAVSRATYPDLFTAIGTTYGVGDGSTTFNLPNLQGRIPVGKDAAQTEFDTLAETGGAKAVALTETTTGPHSHSFQGTTADASGSQLSFHAVPNDSASALTIPGGTNIPSNLVGGNGSSGGGFAHENMPPYIVLNYIIKV